MSAPVFVPLGGILINLNHVATVSESGISFGWGDGWSFESICREVTREDKLAFLEAVLTYSISPDKIRSKKDSSPKTSEFSQEDFASLLE